VTRARGILAAVLVTALAAGAVSGCSKKMQPVQNLAPETYVYIQGRVDPVSHRVHLYWYGTDPDGSISAYAIRWVYPAPAPQDVKWDTLLVGGGGSVTDSMFTMFTGDTLLVTPRFEVMAIDNQGLADPSPAVQDFSLTNTAPLVQLTNPLGSRDTTYASVTFSWNTIDPDGGGPGLHYRIWLDGNEARDSTEQQTFTMPSARFLQDGAYRSGLRTCSIQAVDDGGRPGPVTSFTWFVRAPAAVIDAPGNRARLLVIDDVPSNAPNNFLFDGFYKSVADLLPAGTYEVLRRQFIPNIFRSNLDVTQTFSQYQAVLWYRGGDFTIDPWLQSYEDGIGAYLDGGGNLYIDGLYLIRGLRTPGSLSPEFVTRHCGSDGLYRSFGNVGGGVVDSSEGWGARVGSRFRSSVYGESFGALVTTQGPTDSSGGMRAFVVRDTNDVALWAPVGQLAPPNDEQAPAGVTVRQGTTGRLILISMPIRYAPPAQATNLLRRMLNSFGIGIPAP
jgi:hypothetical protein